MMIKWPDRFFEASYGPDIAVYFRNVLLCILCMHRENLQFFYDNLSGHISCDSSIILPVVHPAYFLFPLSQEVEQVVSGLQSGQEYRFSVAGRNAAGLGEFSGQSNPLILGGCDHMSISCTYIQEILHINSGLDCSFISHYYICRQSLLLYILWIHLQKMVCFLSNIIVLMG